jgi:signal transduction histidine kinase
LRIVVHEMRQPLAAVLALAEVARSLPGITADVRRYLDLLIEQVQEVSGAAWNVLGPRDPVDSHPADVDELLDSVCGAFRLTWSGSLIRLGDRGGLLTTGSRAALRRCLVNVMDNAVRAAGPVGTVVVTVSRDAESIWIVVDDDGPGFGRVAHGTGVGLAVTRHELGRVGGTLSVGLPSQTGGGRVALSLPLRLTRTGYADEPVRAG